MRRSDDLAERVSLEAARRWAGLLIRSALAVLMAERDARGRALTSKDARRSLGRRRFGLCGIQLGAQEAGVGYLSITLNGEHLFGFSPDGQNAGYNDKLAEPPATPPRDSEAFAAGHRRFQQTVATVAAMRRMELRRPCGARARM